MSKLMILRGLPGSGKTTFAKTEVFRSLADASADHRPKELFVRVNRDSIREMLHDGAYIPGVTEDVVIKVRDAIIRTALQKGQSVISDDTNLKNRTVRQLLEIADDMGSEIEIKDFTNVLVEECISRDLARENGVGEDVIRDMHNRFIKGKPYPLPTPGLKLNLKFEPIDVYPRPADRAIIVDIDGTVAHNDGHRGFYEYDRVQYDQPHYPVIEVVKALRHHEGCYVLFVSGREDVCREETAQWIEEYVGVPAVALKESNENQWGPDKLFMRPHGDQRDDAEVKYEIYRDRIVSFYQVRIVLDDRNKVVDMWRQIGLTCLQVAPGDF